MVNQKVYYGGLAQLARASALHAEGQRFESVILHNRNRIQMRFQAIFDMVKMTNK